jgi:dolichyl-diphosphooligosaccharide--protein glycosyltransferase
MGRDVVVLILLAGAALGIRVYPSWSGVLGGSRVNFLETDAWYHVRLIENQVANFPSRVTVDPYAAQGGQFVPIAPLYDTLTAAIVVTLAGRDADAAAVERIAAFVPPVLGALAVLAAGVLALRVFGVRAAYLSAALLAVLPGHFMDRTRLGFVDHHALEALLALTTLTAVIVMAMRSEDVRAARPTGRAGLATFMPGVMLGLYLLAWASGALLVAILGAWLVGVVALSRSANEMSGCSRVLLAAAIVALGLVLAFQHPAMHRYGTQLIALAGLAGMALLVQLVARSAAAESTEHAVARARVRASAALVLGAIVAVVVTWVWRPDQVMQVLTDVGRLSPDPARTGVLEARPLFLYPGEWNWGQPWEFFRSGFYVGLVALLALAARIWQQRRMDELLLWIFTAVMFVATIGQNRFGYYLMPACALLGGWLADRVLALAGRTEFRHAEEARMAATNHGWRSDAPQLVAVVAVSGLLFAPALTGGLMLQRQSGMFVAYWQDAIDWIAASTPAPFASSGFDDRYYRMRYAATIPAPDYTVMNWWDQGYYLIQRARRVPVSNPTQERAGIAARFYTETDEARALAILAREHSRYVLADWELPFRITPQGSVAGRFQTLGDWAGITHADYYQVCYRRRDGEWTPVWIFYEPYYRSMAYRLSVLGGGAATPAGATAVVTLGDRDEASGRRFCEVVSARTFATYESARAVANALSPSGTTVRLAGLDPWQTAFPLPTLTALREVHAVRTPEQESTETPWVRVFAVQ